MSAMIGKRIAPREQAAIDALWFAARETNKVEIQNRCMNAISRFAHFYSPADRHGRPCEFCGLDRAHPIHVRGDAENGDET
ncbi:MAG: hypothetical protein JRN42_05885 [Nitrososphaerota archaeon]|nr:hypothetical protein [Nitrososphaerota archaeon]